MMVKNKVGDNAITDLFKSFRSLPDVSHSDADRVIAFWQDKMSERCDRWDRAHFYSQQQERTVALDLPLKKVIMAVAAIVLDRSNGYFGEKHPEKARELRVRQLYQTLLQVVEHTGLCHTGVRDALLLPLNGCAINLNGRKLLCRFPEQTYSQLQYMQSLAIENAFAKLRQSNMKTYQREMTAWLSMPEDEQEMPDRLKRVVIDHCSLETTKSELRQSWFDLGINPDSDQLQRLMSYYFSSIGLADVTPNAAMGSQMYWHDVSLIFRMRLTTRSGSLRYLDILKSGIMSASGERAIKALHQKIRSFMRVEQAKTQLMRYERELSYQYAESGIDSYCDSVRLIIETYYASGNPSLLSRSQKGTLNKLNAVVQRYLADDLTADFSDFFQLIRQPANYRAQVGRLSNKGFLEKCQINAAWLNHHFPADIDFGTEIEITVAVLNHVLLYALTQPKHKWIDRAEAVVRLCIDFIRHRLGQCEVTADERATNSRIKQQCYSENFLQLIEATLASEITDITAHKKRIIYAISFNYSGSLASLLQQGSEHYDVDASLYNGKSALMIAAAKGSLACVQQLVRAGASVDHTGLHSETALMKAAKYGHAACIKQLVAAGANIDALNDSGMSALFIAVEHGRLDCVTELLASGAACKIDGARFTALSIAVATGNRDMIGTIAAKSTPENINRSLIYAFQLKQFDAAKLLLSSNASKTLFSNCCKELAIQSVFSDDVATLHALVTMGLNINSPLRLGCSLLRTAATHGASACMEYLLLNNAELNTPDIHGNTALMLAACNGKTQCLELLLNAGANVNVHTNSGNTAILLAMRLKRFDCVRKILSMPGSVDLSQRNSEGKTVFDYAADKPKLLHLLLRKQQAQRKRQSTQPECGASPWLTITSGAACAAICQNEDNDSECDEIKHASVRTQP